MRPKSAKITSSLFNSLTNPTQFSVLPELNLSLQDPTVVTTAQSQQKWPPSSSPSLPAHPEHQQPQKQQQLPFTPQQDFCLSDYIPPPDPLPHNRSASVSQPNWDNRNNLNLPPASRLHNRDLALQLAVQNRFLQSRQTKGHSSSSSPAFANRSFYASSAPPSTVALHQQSSRRLKRPPVPPFNSSGKTPQTPNLNNMELGNSPCASPLYTTHCSQSSPLSDIDLEDFTAFGGGATHPASAFPSPANPTYPDFELSSSHSHIGTVSPNDLLVNEPLFSAPNSTAFTALTSPSAYGESPDFASSVDASPLFGADPMDAATWAPLFGPTEQFGQMAAMTTTQTSSTLPPLDHSPATESEDFGADQPPSSRRKSSVNSSPSGRLSATAGVGSRRRTRPLPPIEIKDKDDVVSYKRAKNTLAARKSRERKALRLEELEEKVKALEAERAQDEERLRNVEAERDHWKSLALASGAQ